MLQLRFEGKTYDEIAKTVGVGLDSVQRWLRKQDHAKKVAAKAEIVPSFPTKGQILVEITQDLAKQKLGQIIAEAEKNYNKYNDNGDDKAAAYWFMQFQIAVDRMMRASGVYEKAKKDAEREAVQDNAISISVRWVGGQR